MTPKRRATIALVLLTLLWGYSWPTSKIALQYVGPATFAAHRSSIAALALLAVLLISRRPLRTPIRWQLVLNGLLQTGLTLGLQIWAMVEGGAGKTSVLVFTAPIWTLLLAWPLLGERVRGSQWLAAATTLTGLALIIAPWNLDVSPMAKILGVGSALAFAVSTIVIRRVGQQGAEMMSFNAWSMVLGALFLIAVSALVPEPATRWTGEYVGLLVYTAVLSTALGSFLWVYVLKRIPAWEASLSVLGVPAVGLLSSRLQLGETATGIEFTGILLIGAGLALLSLYNWRQQRRGPD